jgi:hypothetical protein
MSTPGYNDSVFINCPFDDDYKPILRAIVYAIYRCGFFPQTALDEDDGSEVRLMKIYRKMQNCRYGIHDLSRIELNDADLPRFNMPFELGVFFGAKYFGESALCHLQYGDNQIIEWQKPVPCESPFPAVLVTAFKIFIMVDMVVELFR